MVSSFQIFRLKFLMNFSSPRACHMSRHHPVCWRLQLTRVSVYSAVPSLLIPNIPLHILFLNTLNPRLFIRMKNWNTRQNYNFILLNFRTFIGKKIFWKYFFLSLKIFRDSRDSSVGIATGYGMDDRGVGVRVPVGLRIFYSLRRPDRLWGSPKLLSNRYGVKLPGMKLTTHLQLVPRSRKCGSIHPLPHTHS
jgi:hypothetical protein